MLILSLMLTKNNDKFTMGIKLNPTLKYPAADILGEFILISSINKSSYLKVWCFYIVSV